MPLQWRLQVLEAQIAKRFEREFRFEEVDLYRLEGVQRDAAIDALVAGRPLPLALLEEHILCTGALDAEVIGDAIARFSEGGATTG